MSPHPAADPQRMATPAAHAWSAAAAGWLRVPAIALLTIAAGVVYTLGWDSPVRAGLMLVFLLLGPGLAITELLEIRDPLRQLALAIATSLALETLVSVTLLYLGLFSPKLAFGIVAGIACEALLVCVLRDLRAPVVAGDPHAGPTAS